MNRITRCPSCATVYPVGDAQLQQARGWLRCGHCDHVFDSTGLVVAWPPRPMGSTPSQVPERTSAPPAAPKDSADERVDLDALLRTPDRSAPTRPASDELASFEQALSSFKPAPWPELEPTPAAQAVPTRLLNVDHAPVAALPSPAVQVPPSQRLAALAVMGLLFTLLLQLMVAQHSTVLARWPAMAPALAWVCSWAGCRMTPLRDPDALVIESSAFVQRENDHVLRWAVRNTSPYTLGMTAMEVTLLDAQDQILVRRVVPVSQWAGPESLAAGQIDAVQWSVRLDPGLSVSSYRLLTFYP